MRKPNIKLILFILFCPPLACFTLQLPHPEVTSIFITVIGLWLTEAVPLPATGLAVPVLAVLYGTLPASKAFESFGSDILFLFLGCFLMGRSMEKHGFDKRLAYFLLGHCSPGSSFLALNTVLALTAFLLSMWISNTSATAIIAAVTMGILSSLGEHLQDPEIKRKASVRLLLSCAFAASIGGLATPVGSPPNLIALKLLSQQGIEISFIEWVRVALPISALMLIILLVIFELCFPLRGLKFPGIKSQFKKLLKGLGPMRTAEIQIAVIFLITVIFWILPGVLHSINPEVAWLQQLNSRLSMSVVGLIGGLATFFLPLTCQNQGTANLEWSETSKIDWGTLMLFGGGLTLGVLLESSGAAKDIGQYLFAGEFSSILILGCFVVIFSITLSEFASNTASTSILIPLILGVTLANGLDQQTSKNLVLAATFAASFGFMLPVSTPPNAIVFGTGQVPAKDMRKAGLIFDLAGAAIIITFMLLPWKN